MMWERTGGVKISCAKLGFFEVLRAQHTLARADFLRKHLFICKNFASDRFSRLDLKTQYSKMVYTPPSDMNFIFCKISMLLDFFLSYPYGDIWLCFIAGLLFGGLKY